ncbi:hypothetical protein EDB84DRAFT_1577157 [Lactarius hengduanensis]|nr:hypothetical protein EDB84DRAFT_1577157 [Lactarius hengduanensis]
MPLLSSILGFSLFGLGARIGQLGIQKRNLLDNPGGHVISMLAFGYLGYWAHQWTSAHPCSSRRSVRRLQSGVGRESHKRRRRQPPRWQRPHSVPLEPLKRLLSSAFWNIYTSSPLPCVV